LKFSQLYNRRSFWPTPNLYKCSELVNRFLWLNLKTGRHNSSMLLLRYNLKSKYYCLVAKLFLKDLCLHNSQKNYYIRTHLNWYFGFSMSIPNLSLNLKLNLRDRNWQEKLNFYLVAHSIVRISSRNKQTGHLNLNR
jgi:hypothetical protein